MRRTQTRTAGVVVACAGLGCAQPAPATLVVLAPDHSRGALQRVAWEWGEHRGLPTEVVYRPAAELVRLVDTGTTADVVIAPEQALAALEGGGHIATGSRRALVGDQLVVARHIESASVRLDRLEDLLEPGLGAVAAPDAETLIGGVAWTLLETSAPGDWSTRLQAARDAPAVAELVRRREARFGIMEGARAAFDPDLGVALTLSAEAGPAPLVYEAAVVSQAQHPDAADAFVQSLVEEPVRAAFLRVGFVSLRQRDGMPGAPPPTAPPPAPVGPNPPPAGPPGTLQGGPLPGGAPIAPPVPRPDQPAAK